jgi:hypothetical protein
MNENCYIRSPEQVVGQLVWKDKTTRFKEIRAMITCVGSLKSPGKINLGEKYSVAYKYIIPSPSNIISFLYLN